MGILNFLKKACLRASVLVATLVASAACSGLYEENFYANDYHPELSRSDSTILADTPNVRRVFVLFSFGYNNLSYDLKEDIEDVIASGVPEYGFDENVVLVLSQNLPNGYSYSQPSAPVLTHIYSRGEEIIRDTLKVYADTTVAARKAVVEDVLTIAKDRFPAKRYGILMSSHGTGWAPQGYCYSPPDKKNNSTIWSLNSGAYVAEIIRSGIMSVDPGQMEAGRSLGFNYVQTMRFIILPQAFKAVLPALANEFIVLLKETSVAAFVGVADLTYAGNVVGGVSYEYLFPLLLTAIIYLIMVMFFTSLVNKLERRLRTSER